MPIEDLADKIERHVKRAVAEVAEALAEDIRLTLMTPGRAGRVTLQDGLLHQASAPGEPPAPETGLLADSIEAVEGEGADAQVAATAPYARALELGTFRVAPRPFLRPALDAIRPDLEEAVARAVEHILDTDQ